MSNKYTSVIKKINKGYKLPHDIEVVAHKIYAHSLSEENFANNDIISKQAKPEARLEILSQPFQHNQVGVATVGDIEKAGGTITLDGKLNSSNRTMIMNHATVDGLTAPQAEKLFQPTKQNLIPKGKRGAKSGC